MHMKGELKIKRKSKSSEETVTFDPRLSQDKKNVRPRRGKFNAHDLVRGRSSR